MLEEYIWIILFSRDIVHTQVGQAFRKETAGCHQTRLGCKDQFYKHNYTLTDAIFLPSAEHRRTFLEESIVINTQTDHSEYEYASLVKCHNK